MTLEEFINETKKLGINLTEQNLKDLNTYKEKLIEYNQKFNLTSILEEKDIYLKHFYDSLTLTKVIDLNQNLKVLDIGTGAGFPGLVLKIIFPNLEITLIDSNHKKILFLNAMIDTLKLSNITCIPARAEELSSTYREYFDVVTSRAVSELRILAELSIPYLKVGGYFLPMKASVAEEIKKAQSTLTVLKSKIVCQEEFVLPIEGSTRTILKIQKLEATSNLYPRTYDKIKKKPLK